MISATNLSEILLLRVQAKAVTAEVGKLDTSYNRKANLLMETLAETNGAPPIEFIEGEVEEAADRVHMATADFNTAVQGLHMELSEAWAIDSACRMCREGDHGSCIVNVEGSPPEACPCAQTHGQIAVEDHDPDHCPTCAADIPNDPADWRE